MGYGTVQEQCRQPSVTGNLTRNPDEVQGALHAE